MPKSKKSSAKSAKKSAKKSQHSKKSSKKSSRHSDLLQTLDLELSGSPHRNSTAEGEASAASPPLSPTAESAANSSGSDHSQLHSPSSSHRNGEADQSRDSPRSDVEFLGHTAASGANVTDLQRQFEDVAENTAAELNSSSVCVKSPLPSRASPQPRQDSVAPETIQFTDALLQPSNIKTPTPLPTL